MNKQEIRSALNAVARARKQWAAAHKKYDEDLASVMRRLLFEAAHNFMSVADIAQASGLTQIRVRKMMRANGLDPKQGKRVLSATAAKAIEINAAALGISPHEMDLTSPLAYLPMGEEMRRSITGNVSKVTDMINHPVTIDLEDLRAVLQAADYMSNRELVGPVDRMSDAVALATMQRDQ